MLAIHNVGMLAVVGPGPVGGRSMSRIETLALAALLIDGGTIAWFGCEKDLSAPADCEAIDAEGGCVVPELIDCHTHAVFGQQN